GIAHGFELGADEAAAQADDAAVALGVASGVFEGEARALGKAEEDGAFGGNACLLDVGEDAADKGEGGGEPGFIGGKWLYETIGIPRVVSGLGGEVGEVGILEFVGEEEDVVGGCAASVNENHGGMGAVEWCAGLEDGLGEMGVLVGCGWI